MPAVSARSVSQTMSARCFCAASTAAAAADDRLGALGRQRRERLEDPSQVSRAASGREALVHPPPVGDQADAVAGRERDLRQRQRRIDHRVQFRPVTNPCPQQPSPVDRIQTAWLRPADTPW